MVKEPKPIGDEPPDEPEDDEPPDEPAVHVSVLMPPGRPYAEDRSDAAPPDPRPVPEIPEWMLSKK